MFNNLRLHLLHIHFVTQLSGKARYTLVDKTAWVDVVEILEVGVHIHGKAVHGYIAARTNTYGTYFSGTRSINIEPHARSSAYATCLDAPLSAYTDDGLLKCIDILAQADTQLLQIQNRIAHHLTMAMEGDVATAVDMIKLGPDGTQVWLRDEQILALATLA